MSNKKIITIGLVSILLILCVQTVSSVNVKSNSDDKPDLIITNLEMKRDINEIRQIEYWLYATVKNVGNSDYKPGIEIEEKAFVSREIDDGGYNLLCVVDKEIKVGESFKAGGIVRYFDNRKEEKNSSGVHEVVCYVDYYDYIEELNEDNNYLKENFKFPLSKSRYRIIDFLSDYPLFQRLVEKINLLK